MDLARFRSTVVSLAPSGNAPLASPERSSNLDGRPRMRPPSNADVALARKREIERQLLQRIRNFHRGGRQAWEDYHTFSESHIKIAFRIQSTFICMYDIYQGATVLNDDGESWEDALDGLYQYLENSLIHWNPELDVNRYPGNFEVNVGMVSNSHRCFDAMDRLNFAFFEYLSQKVDIAKLFHALMVSCTLGRWGPPRN